ncbi:MULTISPECIES: hypothetical protein [Neomoorella]|uniref:hypothetical protein n=1 Tax=Neomoorella TaxID=44260 RepID=UPI0008FB8167|nr:MULTISPECIES: hypothetical protein [Moorella]OIQ53421.1 hypothetical protein MORE_21490 [Moorella thermoacetica]OIQ59928.1 hypothetical protein MTIN_21000 [Moorella thermoacetica]BCV20378.1 hypothetical protein hamaS1_04470 [Moorella sp. Hama-1]
MANMALKAYCWIGAKAAALKKNKGFTTLEMMLILGTATILLIGTYFGVKDYVIPWWNNHIVPQFPA